MIETEVRGTFSKEVFESKIAEFTTKYGIPKSKRRLAFAFANFKDLNLETKIRITDGKVDLTQKVGHFTALSREEIELKLTSDAEFIFRTFRVLNNLVKQYEEGVRTIIQHEFYIFLTSEFEIKMVHQFGEGDFYHFEVELMNDSKLNLDKVCKELGLEIEEDFNTEEKVRIRSNEINVHPDKLNNEEILSLIKSYL